MRPASSTVTVLVPTVRSPAPCRQAGRRRRWRPRGLTPAVRRPDIAASGNRVPGAWSTTAAYWAGSTNTMGISNPGQCRRVLDLRGSGGNDARHRRDLALQRRGDHRIPRGLDDRVGAHLLPGRGHLGAGYRRADHVRERHHGQHQHQGERRQDGAGRGTGGPCQADEPDHPARQARDPGQLAGKGGIAAQHDDGHGDRDEHRRRARVQAAVP